MDRLGDVLIGSALLAVSVATAGVSYSAIAEQERAKESWISSYLVEGSHQYSLHSHNNCIGNFSVDFDSKNAFSVDLKGTVRASFQGIEVSPQFKGTIKLNPLGQINAANFNAVGGNSSFTLTMSNVNPVALTIEGHADTKKISRSFSIPGPITLVPVGGGRFTLEGPGLHGGTNPLAAHVAGLLLQDIQLSTQVFGASDVPCAGEQPGSADITPMITRIDALVPDWMKKSVSEPEISRGIS